MPATHVTGLDQLVAEGELDAVHLATALRVQPDALVAFDRRLLDAAAEAGPTAASPGA